MQLLTKEFVFSNQPRQRLARHGLFWFVFWVFSFLIYGTRPAQYWHLVYGEDLLKALLKGWLVAAVDALLYLPSHMTLTYATMYIILPLFVFRGKYFQAVLGVIIFMVLSAVVAASATVWVIVPLHTAYGAPSPSDTFFYSMIAGLRGATTIAGFAASIKLAKVWYLKQEAYQQIEREKLQAELQLLKSQVHPHFLFNTLNNLYALTLRKSDRSPAVVLKLSELLSYMLYDCNASEVPVEKEIAFMRNYIGLEQLRYGDRLDMSINISGDYQSKLIAPLLLVPFLENAFKHGTSEQLEQAWMHLDLSVQGTTLKFKLINSREATEHDETYVGGIGLQNVKKRLHLLYPDRHDLRITAEDETFMVTLTLELSPIKVPYQSAVRLTEAV
ncbi:Inner membrane protein yehU [Fibrisoma limi BUZ 3]|uniref:Inner membrane protein yehU n=1 Tax=Fibrisoma limi BUZ 3 TaxID=1185876 RepID=I2GT50_9BACT|nr:histidine kinase [Fibrisoma limi]CCH57079.1 Inner membrane protein yehU [Fibrisoma limi BUZ 3]